MTEGKALRQLQKGSTEGLAWFIERYTPYVGAIVHNVIGTVLDQADVEEATADVFIVFWRRAQQITPGNIKAYLGCIARSEAKKRLRAIGRELPLEEDILILDPDTPEGRLERRELEQAVQSAVLAMSEPDCSIFLRYYYYCQTTAVIAREMAMNESTVKSRLKRGREKLRSVLSKDYLE